MRINSQYIVLIKKSKYQTGPAVFECEMYDTKKFMKKYIEGTKLPYGHFFIDLKQTTPETDKLKTYIFNYGNKAGRDMEESYRYAQRVRDYLSLKIYLKMSRCILLPRIFPLNFKANPCPITNTTCLLMTIVV